MRESIKNKTKLLLNKEKHFSIQDKNYTECNTLSQEGVIELAADTFKTSYGHKGTFL